jgi:hypothetical protein
MATIEKIGGRTFSFGLVPPTRAIVVEVAIARVIGEPLFKALTGADAEIGDSKEQLLQVGVAAVGMMASKMDATELLTTMQTVFEFITVDGERINIDRDFVGRNRELWQVFIKGLQVNFSDFFDGLHFDSSQGLLAKLTPSKKRTSAGTSSGQ